MLKAFAAYAAALGGILTVAAIAVHLLMAHQYRLAVPERLINITHNGEEALERAPHGTPVETVLASVLDAPDEGLAWFDTRGQPLGAAGKAPGGDAMTSRTRIREEEVDGWMQATITSERITAALQQLDLGLAIGTILAMLTGGFAIAAISTRAVARVEAVLGRVNRFTGDAAHELRTPLAVITNNADGLALAEDDAGLERRLTNIRQAARQMRELMEGLLILARVDEGVAHDLHAIDVGACVEEVAQTYRDAAVTRGLAVRVHRLAGQTIYGQPDQVTRILGNLVENALHHTPPGGSIEIACTAERNAALIAVTDTGIGIAPDELERVFERFWRGAGARPGEGSGLGLAIAQSLARAHGGDLRVRSRPGAGSTFTLRIPLHPHRSAALSTVS